MDVWYMYVSTLIATVWFETVAQIKGFWGEYKIIKVQEVITGRRTIKDRMTPARLIPRCSFLFSWTEVCLNMSICGSIGRKKMVNNYKSDRSRTSSLGRYSTHIWIETTLE